MEGYAAFFKLLNTVMVINRDNGRKFTNTGRLDAISALLWNTSYRRIDANGLFQLYAKKPLRELPENVIVVSSHVDCQKHMTRCFAEEHGGVYLLGTFDNALTNAAVLRLMIKDVLRDNVVIAFTGDEEEDSHGALDVVKYFSRAGKQITVAVLDVTDMGWNEGCDFTIENNFWRRDTGKTVIDAAASLTFPWRFVPSDLYCLPEYVPPELVIPEEAEPDESWSYDEKNIDCFSLCIPTKGNMHSDEGVLARKSSIFGYIHALEKVLEKLSAAR